MLSLLSEQPINDALSLQAKHAALQLNLFPLGQPLSALYGG